MANRISIYSIYLNFSATSLTMITALLTILQNNIEDLYLSEEPLSFYQKRQLDFEKQCKLLNIEINSPEAEELRKKTLDSNNNIAKSNACTNLAYDEV